MAHQHIQDPPPGDETGCGGAVAPVARSVRPVGGSRVRLTGGLPAAWRRRNREATVPHTPEERILLPLHRS